jgi:hypothetical protein
MDHILLVCCLLKVFFHLFLLFQIGRPPKDATHIGDLKHVIETFLHPNITSGACHQDTGGTLPVDSNVWTKLTGIGYSTIETKEVDCIGYNGFLFPHEYSDEGRGA